LDVGQVANLQRVVNPLRRISPRDNLSISIPDQDDV